MTDPTADAKLLPCPFCGGVAECKPDEVGSGGQHVPPYWAACRTCEVAFMGHTSEEAASRWNTRPQPAPPEGEPDFDMAKFAMVAKRLIPGDYLTKIIGDDDIRMFQTCAYRASIEHELRKAYRLGLAARPKAEDAEVTALVRHLRRLADPNSGAAVGELWNALEDAADRLYRLAGERDALSAEVMLEGLGREGAEAKLAEREAELAKANELLNCEDGNVHVEWLREKREWHERHAARQQQKDKPNG